VKCAATVMYGVESGKVARRVVQLVDKEGDTIKMTIFGKKETAVNIILIYFYL